MMLENKIMSQEIERVTRRLKKKYLVVLIILAAVFCGSMVKLFLFSSAKLNKNITPQVPNVTEQKVKSDACITQAPIALPFPKKSPQKSSRSAVFENTFDNKMLDDLADDILAEAEDVMNTEFTFADLLPKEHKRYDMLLQQLRAMGDRVNLTLLVDLVESGIEEHWWSKNPVFAYKICNRALQHLEDMGGFINNENALILEKTRLLVWKSQIERVWGGVLEDIPEFDDNAGKIHFARLKELKPSTEIQKYRLKRLLIEGQTNFLGTLTDASQLVDIIDSPPVTENLRDQISMARDKAWAFIEQARVLPESKEWVAEKALLQQYAIDYVNFLQQNLGDTSNTADRRYFEYVSKQAHKQLEQTKALAESLGLKVSDLLANRIDVQSYHLSGSD